MEIELSQVRCENNSITMSRKSLVVGILLGSIGPAFSQQVIYESGVNVVTVAGKAGVPGDRDGNGADSLLGGIGSVATIGEAAFVVSYAPSGISYLKRIENGLIETISSNFNASSLVSDAKRVSLLASVTGGIGGYSRIDREGNVIGSVNFFSGSTIRGDLAVIPRAAPIGAGDTVFSIVLLDLSNGNSKFLAGGGLLSSFDGAGEAAGIRGLSWAAMGDGLAYIFDGGGLRTVTMAGVVKALVRPGYTDGPVEVAKAESIQGMTVDMDGNLIFAQQGSIRRLRKNRVETMAGNPSNRGAFDGDGFNARFSDVRGIAIDSANRLWVADQNCVRLVTFKESRKDVQPLAEIRLVPGITVNGEIGAVYRIEFQESVGGPWQLLRMVALSKPTEEFFDYSAGGRSRFYRAIAPE